MKARRVIIIESMFRDICTPAELRTVNELYRQSNKGSAVVYMLKRIRAKWNEFVKNTSSNSVFISQQEATKPRMIKINGNGISRYESI